MGDRSLALADVRWRPIALLGLALLAGCGAKQKRLPPEPPPASPPPAAIKPRPPGGAPEKIILPESDGKGGYRTINAGIGDTEAVWHLRSALNVAALSCDRQGKAGIASGYNALLARQKKAFAAAYREEVDRFRSAEAVDRHVTRIYNFYAQPPAQAAFCSVAASVTSAAKDVQAEDFRPFAVRSLARLQVPFDDFYREYERYRMDLAAWEQGDHEAPSASTVMADRSASRQPAPPWLIQLGAYSGDTAARDAWDKIRRRLTGVARFTPLYTPVPGKPLVRVQIGPVLDRTEAIALCAAAAGAGLDCLPVAGDRPI